MDKSNWQAGQNVYLIPKRNGSSLDKTNIQEATVTKVGTKYVTVGRQQFSFNLQQDGCLIESEPVFGTTYVLAPDWATCNTAVKKQELIMELRKAMYHIEELPLETLQEINELLEAVQNHKNGGQT